MSVLLLNSECVLFSNTEILSSGVGGFLPAMKQIGNVAALPGIVHVSLNRALIPFSYSQKVCGMDEWPCLTNSGII